MKLIPGLAMFLYLKSIYHSIDEAVRIGFDKCYIAHQKFGTMVVYAERTDAFGTHPADMRLPGNHQQIVESFLVNTAHLIYYEVELTYMLRPFDDETEPILDQLVTGYIWKQDATILQLITTVLGLITTFCNVVLQFGRM